MLKLIVPTDFSSNAVQALYFAIELANRAGGYIQLYHVYDAPSSTTGSFISVEQYIRKTAEAEMQKLVALTKSLVKSKTIIDYAIAQGSPIKSVCQKAERDHYDLVVMGTTGASGLKGKLIGSNAAGILSKTSTPLLAIPQDAQINDINNIVVAIDGKPLSHPDKVEMLKLIQDSFQAKITLFHLEEEPKAPIGIDSSVKHGIKYQEIDTLAIKPSQSIHSVIDHFAQENQADLLCMIKRKRGKWQEWRDPSITKREVKTGTIPLLILHD